MQPESLDFVRTVGKQAAYTGRGVEISGASCHVKAGIQPSQQPRYLFRRALSIRVHESQYRSCRRSRAGFHSSSVAQGDRISGYPGAGPGRYLCRIVDDDENLGVGKQLERPSDDVSHGGCFVLCAHDALWRPVLRQVLGLRTGLGHLFGTAAGYLEGEHIQRGPPAAVRFGASPLRIVRMSCGSGSR